MRRELLARIRIVLRLSQDKIDASSLLSFGAFSIDLAGHIVRKNNNLINITSTEFSLLALIARNSVKILTHQYLLK